jgi:hypothetical protein
MATRAPRVMDGAALSSAAGFQSSDSSMNV